jgi:exopolysaccharide biosynthesis predicted pyruvyltransferase EpsI
MGAQWYDSMIAVRSCDKKHARISNSYGRVESDHQLWFHGGTFMPVNGESENLKYSIGLFEALGKKFNVINNNSDDFF